MVQVKDLLLFVHRANELFDIRQFQVKKTCVVDLCHELISFKVVLSLNFVNIFEEVFFLPMF